MPIKTKPEGNEQLPDQDASALKPETLPVEAVAVTESASPATDEDNRYRNISTTHHTIEPDGRSFAPGDVAQLLPQDIERLARAGHIFKVKPRKGGKA
jgi:hypothetical protein